MDCSDFSYISSQIKRKLRLYRLLFYTNKKLLALNLAKDFSKIFFPLFWNHLHEKWRREADRNSRLKIFNITYFYNLEALPALLEMYCLRERIEFKDFLPKRGDVVIDCGASLGDYTLLYSSLVGKEGKIVAFEPNGMAFNLLVKNIDVNGVKNIIALNMAVYDKAGIVTLKRGKYSTDDRIVYLKARSKDLYTKRATTIDATVKKLKLPKVDLIKIDVEGAEYQVLKGALFTLEKFRPKIIVEVHEWIKKGIRRRVLKYLERLGYKLIHEYYVGNNTYELFLRFH